MTDTTQGSVTGDPTSPSSGTAGGASPAPVTLPVDSSPGGEAPLPPSVKARLDELTAEKWAKHREAAAAEARARVAEAALAAAQERLGATGDRAPQASPPARGPEPAPRGAPINDAAQIEARAQELARTQIFNEKCQRVFTDGCQAFPDFQVKLADLNRMVGGNLSREFVEAALATGKPHEAIYKVAADPSLADRVMTMSPLQQVVEMDRLVRGTGGASTPPVSGAPRPITPQVNRGTGPVPNLEDENISIQDWITLREKDLKDRGVNRRLT